MIPVAVWRASEVGPGAQKLLLALWDHAHDWRPGDGEWFVWPSHETLQAKIGVRRSAVYRNLGKLRTLGYIRDGLRGGHRGWWLLRVGEATSRRVRGRLSASIRFRILKRDGFRCRYCGVPATDAEIEIDHVLPVALGGTDDEGNLCAACFSCNRGKGATEVAS